MAARFDLEVLERDPDFTQPRPGHRSVAAGRVLGSGVNVCLRGGNLPAETVSSEIEGPGAQADWLASWRPAHQPPRPSCLRSPSRSRRFWHPCSQMQDYDDFPPLAIVAARGARLRSPTGARCWTPFRAGGASRSGTVTRACGPDRRPARTLRARHRGEHHPRGAGRALRAAARLTNGATAGAARSGARTGRAAAGAAAGHFGKVFLADNGSTAVEVALEDGGPRASPAGSPRAYRLRVAGGGLPRRDRRRARGQRSRSLLHSYRR